MTIPLNYYLFLSAALFVIGMVGVLTGRNLIMIFMAIELMINAANITLVAYASFLNDMTGQILAFFVMAVAAAESAIGLAIVISVYRNKQTVFLDQFNLLKW